MTREPVIFMQFEAMPSEAIAERDNVSGAHVDCWIQARDPEQAEARGRHWIAKEGWVVVGVKQWRPVDVDAETAGRLRTRPAPTKIAGNGSGLARASRSRRSRDWCQPRHRRGDRTSAGASR